MKHIDFTRLKNLTLDAKNSKLILVLSKLVKLSEQGEGTRADKDALNSVKNTLEQMIKEENITKLLDEVL